MKLFNKIKDILFDEEDDFSNTEKITITPEMRNEDIPAKEIIKEVEKKEEKEVIREKTPEVRQEVKKDVSERELFKTSPNFPFLDFDEEEFDNQNVKMPEKRPSNVFEFEKRKRVEKRTDYGRYERTEITETTEKKKFKPSPIISPVYGVLNKDYQKDDIVKRQSTDKIDIQAIRDKAFGDKKEEEKVLPKREEKVIPKTVEEPKVTYYEETETVTITEPAEKEKSVKTIDELLEDTSDVIVDIDHDLDITDDIEIPDIKEIRSDGKEEENTKELNIEPTEEDTSDLFDLIDSMYDTKEDDE